MISPVSRARDPRGLSQAHAAILFALVQSEGARIRIEGSGQSQVAHARSRHHNFDAALAYAPVHRTQTLNQWAQNPAGR